MNNFTKQQLENKFKHNPCIGSIGLMDGVYRYEKANLNTTHVSVQ